MCLPIDNIRDPEEKELQKKLSGWLASDTILDMMATAAGNATDTDSIDGLTRVSSAIPTTAALVNNTLKKLGIGDKNIPVYIAGGNSLDSFCRIAYTPNGYKEYIILAARLFDLLTDDEMRAVIAHEAAHLHFGHHRLAICIDWLNLDDKQGRLYALANLYRYWQQLAELTADRAAFLAVEDPRSAITCLARRNLQGLTNGLDVNRFLKEQKQLLLDRRLVIPRDHKHPSWEFRGLALECFSQSSLFKAIRQNEEKLPVFPEEVGSLSEHLKVSPNERQFVEFCFLLAAGNYLICADRHIHKAEINRLRDILARLIHTPDQKMVHGGPVCGTELLKELGAQINATCPDRKEPVFELLSTLMVQDGRIVQEEKEALDMIGNALGIPASSKAKIILKVLRREFHPTIPSGYE
ncbi:hypothetical protein C4565_10110 [Candidatus Parcubacteria bacterium]|jgi:uncharacterized tellurite resistance protein B-like protein|nr:MAG: hypothetical protein C4565_10110 [Candidatus Parcubacteria bacterium]